MKHMIKHTIKSRSIKASLGFAAIIALALSAIPAQAADPVFPTGSRLGLVPPTGMVQSRAFEGFDEPGKNAAILLSALPAAAYDQLDKSMAPEALKKQGVEIDKREPIELTIGKGFILSGKQTTGTAHYRKWLLVAAADNFTALVTVQVPEQDEVYTDKVVRDALATLALRASVPDAERLSLLPFTVGNMAGFHIDDILPGRALMLVDAPADAVKDSDISTSKDSGTGKVSDAGKDLANRASLTHFLIAAMQGGPQEPKDREGFARDTFDQIGGIKDVRIQDSEPLRIGGLPGYQTMAKAKDGQSDTDIMIVQWLRFGGGGFIQMIGIARADVWPDAFTRLRTVRDSIDPK
jgi:hypothetical protein